MIFPWRCALTGRQVDHGCTVRTTILSSRGKKAEAGRTSWDRYCSTREVSQRASLGNANYKTDLSYTCEEV